MSLGSRSQLAPAVDIALLVLRLFTGFVLIYGTQDNVFDRERMVEFSQFLAANRFPAPLAAAYLSAYAQCICGVLIGLGWLTRPAALVMAVNFVVALVMVHWTLPFSANISPLAMLVNAVCLALAGPGAYALDGRRHRPATEG